MSVNDKKQAVIIIVAILVLAGLGYLGYRLYSSSKGTATKTTTTSSQTSSTQTNNTSNTSTPSQATYLDIKELGIKILLNSQISDAMYSVVPTTDGSKGVGISAQSLLDKSADCSPSNFTLGLIEATTTAPTLVGGQQKIIPDNKSLFKFGNTYYWYRPPQNQTCLTDNQTDIDTVASKLNAFEQAFATAQPDN